MFLVAKESLFTGFNTNVFLQSIVYFLCSIFILVSLYYLIHIGNKFLPEDKKIAPAIKKILKYIFYIFVAYIIYRIFAKFESLRILSTILIVSVIIAYLLNPLVIKLEKSRYLNRKLSVIIVFSCIVLVFALLLVSVIPQTVQQFKGLVLNLPRYLNNTLDSISEYLNSHLGKNVIDISLVTDYIYSWTDKIKIHSSGDFDNVLSVLKNTMSKIFISILTPIFVFYFLSDKEYFINVIKSLLPKKRKKRILEICRKLDVEVFSYVKGRILMAVYVGVATGIFLAVIGVEFALPIALITIFADIIPYIGPLLGLVPAVVFAFMDNPIKALWVLVIYIFLQWTENNLIGPKILSGKIGIHPMVVLLAILVGGFTAGFTGMILILPVMIVIRTIYLEIKNKNVLNFDEEVRNE